MDHHWAIARALDFPERLKIEGFVAAHYGQRGRSRGIVKSRTSLEAPSPPPVRADASR